MNKIYYILMNLMITQIYKIINKTNNYNFQKHLNQISYKNGEMQQHQNLKMKYLNKIICKLMKNLNLFEMMMIIKSKSKLLKLILMIWMIFKILIKVNKIKLMMGNLKMFNRIMIKIIKLNFGTCRI